MEYISAKDEKSIKASLKSLALSYLEKVYNTGKEICSFGIFTDSDIAVFKFAYNNEEGMNIIRENGISFNKEFPNEQLPIDSGKWSIPEWISGTINDEQEYQSDEEYDAIYYKMEELRKASNWTMNDPGNFPLYKEEMFDIFCEVLKDLKLEGRFTKTSEDFFLLVEEGDIGVYGNRDKSLMKIMTKEQYENYIKDL